jgi:hypothetical protein
VRTHSGKVFQLQAGVRLDEIYNVVGTQGAEEVGDEIADEGVVGDGPPVD